MKKSVLIIILFTVGCASSLAQDAKSVLSRYETVIYDDGISLEEAKIIAQRELIRQQMVRLYDLSAPEETSGVSDLPRASDYWLISFRERSLSSIAFIFTVIIDKKSGFVKFTKDHAEGDKWALEAALLR